MGDQAVRRVLTAERMSVDFTTSERTVAAVRNLSFHIDAGETLAIVGESGSGKSFSSQAIMRLTDGVSIEFSASSVQYAVRVLNSLSAMSFMLRS
ncbi:MAG: glutathione transport system ATP-binding protein [Burkholderiaceae bacterium]|jgi:glutathione transport system ATP-binding protein